ncbi:LacI family DNA-binding transcriptional regulator [Pelagovum pacificum]|uniref:LacI family DNA-binding transcriptional regulator n=1 Tax=Pelagovum pacificum TaxID=2588711 RepID=UPI0022B10207|nr:LacI family DNA-binding transcriptional regulator [Pelagovum pacificum]
MLDVAREANCSPMTASRAIKTPEAVSPKLRQRVQEAIRLLNYVPNLNARALAAVRTEVLGVIVPSLTQHIFTDVLRGIYDGVQGTALQVQLGNSFYDDDEETRLIAQLLRQKPTALIVSGVDQSDQARELLEQANCPVVQIMDITDDPIDHVIGFDHKAAGKAITRHLVEEGYNRIAFVGGWLIRRSTGRLLGFKEALEEAGLLDESLIVSNPDVDSVERPGESTTVELGRRLASELLSRHARPDAIFCNNDVLALGVAYECQARNIRIPEEMGVAGFNDLDQMQSVHPPISSLRTHRYEIGRKAVDTVLKLVDGATDIPRVVDVGFEVMKRQSTNRSQA